MNGDGSVSCTLQPAYILHYTQYQESSFIVDAFTLNHGRIALMARSARNSKPRTRALYQPFRPLLLSWVGAGDLRTLTGIEESGPAIELLNAELACGYYFNELVIRLLGKDQPQPMIFAHYSLALADLANGDRPFEVVLRTFELQLLDTLGVLPNLAHCTSDGLPVDPPRQYRYHPANSVAVPTNETPTKNRIAEPSGDAANNQYLGLQKEKHRLAEGDTRNVSVHADGMTPDKGILVSGATLMAMAELDFSDPSTLSEAKVLMRAVLRVHLGDKPLRSRELFESLARP